MEITKGLSIDFYWGFVSILGFKILDLKNPAYKGIFPVPGTTSGFRPAVEQRAGDICLRPGGVRCRIVR